VSTNRRTCGTVYLIHFDRPFKHARHYLGWALDLDARLEQHRNGQGARLLNAVNLAGITWSVARVWTSVPIQFERALKLRRDATTLCPTCRQARSEHRNMLKRYRRQLAKVE